jgi:LPS-assembly lipoprotein
LPEESALNRPRRHLVAVLLAVSLAGCGYHLRGSTPDSQLSFESVYVDAPSGTPLERELRTAIRSQRSTKLIDDPKAAMVSLRVLDDKQERKVLTLNSQGQVREFSLTYRIRYELADRKNKKLLEPAEIALQTILSYSESQVLAKEQEEKLIFDDLRHDAISQIMRQLAQVKAE